MQLANKLWCAGIKAEFGFKPNPKMGDQLGYALEQGIPFMILFGDDELQQGVVKVRVVQESTDACIYRLQFVSQSVSLSVNCQSVSQSVSR